ncbi:MAG TPA: penicillin-binding protein 2 [Anaeromyxobacteraceae bacterium]|nr:penicillin-binding protein 2 [Anaeromyxobacteraceae bacterium]
MSLLPGSAPGATQSEFRPKLAWATLFVFAAFMALFGKLFWLQVVRGEEYRVRAEDNYLKEVRIPADRGLIFDRNHVVLVDQRPSFDVTLTANYCGKQCEEIIGRLATILGMTPEEHQAALDRLAEARWKKNARFKPFVVRVDVRREDVDVIDAQNEDLPGVDVQPVPHRDYRYAGLGGHLIGYMNEVGAKEMETLNQELKRSGSEQVPYSLGDYVGRRGLERRFERNLRGVDGVHFVPVDSKGRALDANAFGAEERRVVPSRPGQNLVLSIDWRLQEFAEKTFPATAGVVAAMDAKTGFLLALVDRPAPDPNKMSGRISAAELKAIHEDPLQPELFRAIQQHYHPGSTYKVVTSIAALEEGLYRPTTTVMCPGYYAYGNHRWRCDKESGHGPVDFEHALGASCDVFFYAAGANLGADALAKWARALGLGQLTGFDIAGEVPGTIPDVAWHDAKIRGGYQRGMAINLAIGQGDVNVTPMQEVVMYGALATGTVWRPQVVLRVEDADGRVVQEFAPEARSKLGIKESTRETVLKGLLAAVNEPYGTGWYSRLEETTMAGKTGTAQVVTLGAKRLRAADVPYFQRDHAWFAAFAPAQDPEIVVVVLNEHSGFGASNAAPTASALVKKYLELKAQDAAAARPGGVASGP